jgi:hypothetical protein
MTSELNRGTRSGAPTRPEQAAAKKGAKPNSPCPRTGSSNPLPSSGESIANPTFSIRTNPVSGFAVDCRLALALEGSRGRVQHWRRCRGPPSDGVAGAGRGGQDRGCRSGDSHGAGDGYPQAILPAAGNARPARRYSWHTRQMSDRMQCLEIAITPGGNDGQGSRCRIFSLARRVWRTFENTPQV